MKKSEVEKRRKWQEQVYGSLCCIKRTRVIDFLGRNTVIKPGVFAPLWMDSRLLGKIVEEEVERGDYVLDLGTGSGVQGRIAAEKAGKVLCTDINPKALVCARETMALSKLKNVDFRKSDLFDKIPEKFDLVIYNPPFRWFKPRDMLERACTDENYVDLERFIVNFRDHLTQRGSALVAFSHSGNEPYLYELITKHKVFSEVVGFGSSNGWGYRVYRFRK